MAAKKTATGLPPQMPKSPGNAKAGKPADRREAGGQLPDWLNPAKAKWTAQRIAALDQRRRARAGVHQVDDSQLTDIPGYRIR
jgi:hypothetical protein